MSVVHYLTLFIGGFLGSFYGSSVGGGALVVFPLLLFSGYTAPVAIATQRCAAIFMEGTSIAKYHANGRVTKRMVKLGLGLGFLAAIGASIGSLLLIEVSETTLNKIAGFLLLGMLTLMVGSHYRTKTIRVSSLNELIFAAVAITGIGVYGGFFGAGFGTMAMMLLMSIGFSVIDASPTARIIGLIMAITSTMIFFKSGMIAVPTMLSVGLGNCIGSWIGIGVGLKKGERYMKALLVIVAVATAIRLLTL